MRGRILPFVSGVLSLAIACVTWGGRVNLTAEETPKAAATTPLPADANALPNVPRAVAEALQDRRYDDAVAAIDAQLKTNPPQADYLTYLKGRALYLAQKYDEAVTVFQEGEKTFAKSPWFHWLQFGRALALARKGDFASAEAMYREQAKRLLSLERKDELAGIYLEFADRLFDPPNKVEEKPDYAKARQFYEKARDLGPSAPLLTRVLFQIARCHQLSGEWDPAAAAYRDFIQRFPEDAREITARLHLGECLMDSGNPAEARRVWEDLLAKYQDRPSAETATAAFRLAETRGMPNPANDEELSLGIAALRQFLEKFPQDERLGQAYIIMARGNIARQRWNDAVTVLEEFLSDARAEKAKERADAMYLLAEVYRQQQRFQDAIGLWRKFVQEFPTHPSWNEAQTQIIETEFAAAYDKFAREEYDAARQAWETFLQLHPLDGRASKILYLFGEMNARQRNWEAAISDWRRLTEKYPEDPWGQQAQLAIAQLYETQLHDPEKALEEYRKVRGGASEVAAAAIARLTAKTMSVETPRVYRSDETPKVRLITRNIDKVSVAVYRLEPEAYFRKMHTLTGVEDLDVALIDPDTTFEFAIPDYQPYVELESFVPINLPGGAKAGAAAVTISSTTFEATTLVLQSDLDVIVKCSREEVLVFGQNMVTGKPWPRARVLVAGKDGILHEATTGEDGVLRAAIPALAQSEDIQILAVADGHLASNALSLAGLQPARGLADRGFIYTDRPVYRAGQIVNVRGIIRFAKAKKNEATGEAAVRSADELTAPEGQSFTLQVLDPENRTLRQIDVTLDRFGCFHDQFLLPQEAEPGDYRVVLSDTSNHTFQGNFRVEVFQLEPIQVTVDVPRRVFYRGEKIEGTIRVEYIFGMPLAEKLVRYKLADQPLQTAMTDAEGKVKFSFETRDYLEAEMLPFTVSLPDRNIIISETFVLATQGFSIELATPRRVYLPGESFETEVNVHDAAGQPIAQKLTLKILKRTRTGRLIGEVQVGEQAIETDAQGSAKPVLHIDEGGEYILRVEGTDRFEHLVSAQTEVKVSDEKDADRLLILADQHTYRVGDEAKLRVHWKDDPVLALVCFQGARILDYRLVPLKKGDNEITVPITAELAPQFELSVALMRDVREIAAKAEVPVFRPVIDGFNDFDWGAAKTIEVPRRFFEVVAPFSVERDLKVSLQWRIAGEKKDGNNPAIVPPGSELEVTVTTTDAQGKPVPAQLSLAMVEASLFQQFGDVPSIYEWFQGERRQGAVRTSASIVFSYHPTTQPINPLLLAEEERAELELAEEAARTALAASRRELERADANQAALSFAMPGGQAGYGGYGGLPAAAPAETEQLADEQQNGQMPASAGRPSRDGRLRAGIEARAAGKEEAKRKQQVTAGISVDRLGELSSEWGLLTPSVENLQLVSGSTRQNFLVLDNKGRLQYFGQSQLAKVDVRSLSRELQKSGSVLFPEWTPHETAFWDPVVETGDNGKAVVKIVIPDRATAWKLSAKGVTVDTRVGECRADLQVKKDLFAEVRAPLAMHEGDRVDLPVTIHNDRLEQGVIKLVSRVTIGSRTVTETKSLDVTRKGLLTLSLPIKAELPEEVRQAIRSADKPDQLAEALRQNLDLEVSLLVGNDETPVDVVRYSILLQPRGVMEFVSTGGSASSDTTAWLELTASPESPWIMEILIGPTVEQSLSDILFGSAQRFLPPCAEGSSLLERTTSDLMAAVALQNYLKAIQSSSGEVGQMLDSRIRSAISTLVAAQNKDGGWSWSGAKKMRVGAGEVHVSSHPESSARAFWAISLARQAGYAVPQATYDNAIQYLERAITQVRADDMEIRSVLVHALALAQRADFALVNRLHRERQSLSLAARLYLALTLSIMQRQPMAAEVLKLVDFSNAGETAAAGAQRSVALSLVEAHALFAMTLQAISPESPQLATEIDWLLSHRAGHRWLPDRATGPAALVLGQWFARTRFTDEKYRLTVFVNDFQVGQFDFDQTSVSQSVLVSPKFFVGGRERIQFRLEGRGRYTYQCLARRFIKPEQANRGSYGSWLRPAPLEVDGREVARGTNSGGTEGVFVKPGWSLPDNRVTELPVGKQAIFEITAAPRTVKAGPTVDQFVLTVPIPSGTSVVPNSVVGPFDRYELRGGEIAFFFAQPRVDAVTVNFRLTGTVPGQYVVEPAVIRNALDPTAYAVIPLSYTGEQPITSLKVLPEGTSSSDAYFLSPLELIALGKSAYARKDWKEAEKHFAELFTNPNWQVMDQTVKELAPLLVDIYLELNQPDKVVHYFEILKVKWPDYEIPFEKILQIATCYERLGEYERSFLIFRAILESSFVNDSYTAGFLDEQNEFFRSVQVMNRLLAEYPPEPYAAAARYALAQRVYAKAGEAATDPVLRKSRITRVHLVGAAWEMLDRFLTAFPEDPAADQAAFAAANALLDSEFYDRAAEAAARYAQRYSDSPLLDSFWYLIGYCRYAEGQHEQAIEMCRKVAEWQKKDATGRVQESKNKWQALYILGQIYHSLGQPLQAIGYYQLVADRFSDAKEAIDYFKRKSVTLPEVTSIKPGEPATLTLRFRNIAQCELKAYRIDLLKFTLLKRDFSGIIGINLAGIRPEYEETLNLGEGQDFRDREHQVKLPFEKNGAYLIVCRGDDLYASGLVLISPLGMEVQEDAISGRVRVTMKDVDGNFVNNVHVKVIGSRNAEFVAGRTDLRGVFVADGIQGRATVIARKESDQYAFYRGQTDLLPAPPQPAQPPAPTEKKPQAAGEERRELLKGLQESNMMLQQQQIENLRQNYQQQRKGVEASKAF